MGYSSARVVYSALLVAGSQQYVGYPSAEVVVAALSGAGSKPYAGCLYAQVGVVVVVVELPGAGSSYVGCSAVQAVTGAAALVVVEEYAVGAILAAV